MHIVCFGDSLTWGKYGGSYVDELAPLMPQHQFINAGIGGDTVVNLLRRVHEVIRQKPDAALIIVGVNDTVSTIFPATRPYYRQTKELAEGFVSLHEFQAAYRELLTHLQLAHIVTYVALPPIEYDTVAYNALAEYNAQAKRVAAALNIPTLDLQLALKPPQLPERPPLNMKTIQLIGQRLQEHWDDYETERVKNSFTFTFDGLHPTPDGAKEIARLLMTLIES